MVHILVQSNFELVSLVLALEATEPVYTGSVTSSDMYLNRQLLWHAAELINNHLTSHFSTPKEMSVKTTFFLVKTTKNKF